MSLSFPVSPSVGQQFQQWAWDGAKWVPVSGSKQIGARLLLSSAVVTTAVASVDIIRTFDNTYDQYELEIYNVQTSAEGAPQLRVSSDGSTFDAGANYWTSVINSFSYPTANNGSFLAATAAFAYLLGGGINQLSVNSFKSLLRISMPWTTDRYKLFDVKSQSYNSTNGYMNTVGSLWWSPPTQAQIKGLRILLSTGNITRGVFNLYGIVKAGAGAT